MEALQSRIFQLEKRLEVLEYNKAHQNDEISLLPDPIDRVKHDMNNRSIFSSLFITVPTDYYSRSLVERSQLLNCHYNKLCKSILLENTCYNENNPFNSKYYCVVLQYCTKIDETKLKNALVKYFTELDYSTDSTSKKMKEVYTKKKYHFTLISSDMNDEITGKLIEWCGVLVIYYILYTILYYI